MAVYLGNSGFIELARTGEGRFVSRLDAADVNINERRFSFDFPGGTFVTGDRIALQRLNADRTPSALPLDFVAGGGWGDNTVRPDGSWFVNVDPLGGIRLYHTWAAALAGGVKNAVALTVPAASYLIAASLASAAPQCLAQIAEYSLETERDAIDVTSLGDAFVQKTSGLISGSGEIRCLWDWVPSMCANSAEEYANYLHQLILRQQLGSEFKANLIVKRAGGSPIDDHLHGLTLGTALYYEVTALVTNVAIAFDPTEALESRITFVTTGEIALRYQVPSAALILQEDSSFILTEDAEARLAQQEDY